jgi:hypothetical protein
VEQRLHRRAPARAVDRRVAAVADVVHRILDEVQHQGLATGQVLVERGRLDAERFTQAAHRQCRLALLGQQGMCGRDDLGDASRARG